MKEYVKPVIEYVGINIYPVMQNMSLGGDKYGNWSGETKERDIFDEDLEW